MKQHECREQDWCNCYALADEPRETCPVHGAGTWPPKCVECGRFLPWLTQDPESDPALLRRTPSEEERQ